MTAEKLHYTLVSAIDILMKKLENFTEEESRQKMVGGNYEIAKLYYAQEFLLRRLNSPLPNFLGTELESDRF